MHTVNVNFIIPCILIVTTLMKYAQGLGRPMVPSNNVGEYGPQNLPPKPYSFSYEVTDEHGNVHYRRESGDPTGMITGSYGYMNANGLFRSVEYMAGADGYRAKVKTNEPGTKGPGSADVDLQADPAPMGLVDMFERKAPSAPSAPFPAPPVARPSYPNVKG